MIGFPRTSAVFDKTLRDLAKFAYLLLIVTQVVFLGLYGFKIYTNIKSPFFLTIYIVLAALSMFGFLFFIFTYKHKKEKSIIGTKRGVRIAKYLANGLMLIMVLVEFVKTDVSDLDIIISVISIVFFLAQVIFEFIRIVYEHYAELFSIALKNDLPPIDLKGGAKGILFDIANAPIEAISSKISGEKKEVKPLTKKELFVEELAKDFKEGKEESQQKHITIKKEKIKKNVARIKEQLKPKRKKKEKEPKQLK